MFATKGDRAQWATVYDHIRHMSIGQQITYAELAAVLPEAPEGSRRGAFLRAVQECENHDKRTFRNIRGIGYRMAEANEHADLARIHHRRGNRQIKKAKRKASSADRSRLTREERARIDAIELNLSRQIEMTRRLEARVERIDADLKTARREQKTNAADLSQRVEQMSALLERHFGISDKQESPA